MRNTKIYENGLDTQMGQHTQAKEILIRNGYAGKFSNFGPLYKGKISEDKYNKFVRTFEIDGFEFHVWNTEKMYMGFDLNISKPIWSEEVYYQPVKTA